ncbi:MAG: adenosylcobinamide-GDP ribazoletransferase [Lachnospiraceae bacterium]|nr:adenosylcobinamide-GDP ribazoletransferase [Lachnospiraceae bacterium]
MRSIWNSFLLALSMYSVSPKAQIERNRENTKYILLFIPIIGVVIGLLISQWAIGYPYLCSYAILPAVVGAVLPSVISAGAHLDGFFRTVDALSSNKSREGKLQILEDSHGGYFAIIVCICYFMISIGIWSEMPIDGLFVLAYSYVISRALYGFSILALPHAKESKCSIYVPEGGMRVVEMLILLLYVGISAMLMLSVNREIGFACLGGAAVSFLYYCFVAFKHFGGVTEDSAGFFIQICEVLVPLAALIAYKRWW